MAFRFRLKQVLQWRQTQRDAEEVKLKQLAMELARAKTELARIKAMRLATELDVRSLQSLAGGDLAALAAYRLHMRKAEEHLDRDCQTRQERVEEQRKRWTEAQRCYKLLEKIKDRQRAEFEIETDRRAEEFATELYLTQWQDPGRENTSSA